VRESDVALFNTDDVLSVDDALVETLKGRARTSPSRRFRLCLHRSAEEAVQEMIVVHCRDNYSRPHRHTVASSAVVDGTSRSSSTRYRSGATWTPG